MLLKFGNHCEGGGLKLRLNSEQIDDGTGTPSVPKATAQLL
jgi:hypothetical protein